MQRCLKGSELGSGFNGDQAVESGILRMKRMFK